jgi:murein DD-endopeptidase MepM/ murein hydrolase activator NlpD
MSERTFKVTSPHMQGADVKAWQETLNRQMAAWNVAYSVKTDGDYGVATRDLTASVCHGLGLSSAGEWMRNGVTPELRTKLRNKNLSVAEKVRQRARAGWRDALRRRYEGGGVAMPTPKVLADSWGYHPGVHDGMDLITPPDAPLYAMCDGTIVRADTGGWWGKAPSGDVSKGDGIIILRASRDVGPIRKGMNLCYGHAEHPTVKAGELVKAGDRIGTAGLAVAWHVHFMVNDNADTRGVGDRDPRPYYDYARKNA